MNKLLYKYKVLRDTILFIGITQNTISDTFLFRKNRFTGKEWVKVKNKNQSWVPLHRFNTKVFVYEDGEFKETIIMPNLIAVYGSYTRNKTKF